MFQPHHQNIFKHKPSDSAQVPVTLAQGLGVGHWLGGVVFACVALDFHRLRPLRAHVPAGSVAGGWRSYVKYGSLGLRAVVISYYHVFFSPTTPIFSNTNHQIRPWVPVTLAQGLGVGHWLWGCLACVALDFHRLRPLRAHVPDGSVAGGWRSYAYNEIWLLRASRRGHIILSCVFQPHHPNIFRHKPSDSALGARDLGAGPWGWALALGLFCMCSLGFS